MSLAVAVNYVMFADKICYLSQVGNIATAANGGFARLSLDHCKILAPVERHMDAHPESMELISIYLCIFI